MSLQVIDGDQYTLLRSITVPVATPSPGRGSPRAVSIRVLSVIGRVPGWIPFEWEEVRLEVMEALGQKDEAQAFRWQCFERTLSRQHLRAYLKRLPDFEDIEA